MPIFEPNQIRRYVLGYDSWGNFSASLESVFQNSGDEELLEFIKNGDRWEKQSAFKEIYRRYADNTMAYAISKTLSVSDAQDIVSEVWIFVSDKIHEFEWRDITLERWVIAITRRKCQEYYRRIEKEKSFPIDDDEIISYFEYRFGKQEDSSMTPSLTSKKLATKLIQQVLPQLSKKEQEIIKLTYWKELNSTEIAERLKTKPGTVRQAHRRVLEKIRKIMDKGDES